MSAATRQELACPACLIHRCRRPEHAAAVKAERSQRVDRFVRVVLSAEAHRSIVVTPHGAFLHDASGEVGKIDTGAPITVDSGGTGHLVMAWLAVHDVGCGDGCSHTERLSPAEVDIVVKHLGMVATS